MIRRITLDSVADGTQENIAVGDEVSVSYTIGDHYSALWTITVVFGIWNGLPRIKSVETKDNWSDR